MNRKRYLLALFLLTLFSVVSTARAQNLAQRTDTTTTTRTTTTRTYTVSEGYPFFGVDLGVAEPTNDNFRAHVHTGASGSPFFGYMMNDWLGIQVQLHSLFFPPDNDHRRNLPGQVDGTGKPNLDNESQWTTMLGATVGPRMAIPIGNVMELYATGQGGGFKGVGGRLNQWAPGFSVGGGLNFNMTPNFALGVFGRWNRAYMSPHPYILVGQKAEEQGPADARWAVGGVGLTWKFKQVAAAPPPPPPPPPMAQAPPPPPPPTKEKIVLRAVHFDFNKSNIRSDARPVLDEAVRMLKERGDVQVVVEGHTDSVGSDAYNMKLSHRRADAVKDYLVSHGIASSRITTEGFGKRNPVASNDTAEGRAQNRRVEIHVK